MVSDGQPRREAFRGGDHAARDAGGNLAVVNQRVGVVLVDDLLITRYGSSFQVLDGHVREVFADDLAQLASRSSECRLR